MEACWLDSPIRTSRISTQMENCKRRQMTEEKIPFGGSMQVPDGECEEAFFAIYPDFFYEGSTALTLWRQAWQAALDFKEDSKPRIQLI